MRERSDADDVQLDSVVVVPAHGGHDPPAQGPSEPLGRSATAGALWLTGQRWLARVSGVVTIAILTRLIEPEDFGVVAAASTITPFVLLLADLGFSTYVVQAKGLDQRVLSTAFTFSATAGGLMCLLMALTASTIASLFRLPAATSVLQAMSVSVLFVVLASVPSALLRRRMQFRLLALQGMVATIAAQIVAVFLAFRGAGVWALVAQLTVTQAVACVLVWRAAGWRPTLEFSGTEFRKLGRFGGKVVMAAGPRQSRSAWR